MIYLFYPLIALLIEYPFFRAFIDEKVDGLWIKVYALNLVSHPLIFFLLPLLELNYLVSLLVSELLVIMLEATLISYVLDIKLSDGLISSTVANLASWQLAPFLVLVVSQVF